MIRRPPRSTRTDTLFPYTTLFRSKNVVSDTLIGTGKLAVSFHLTAADQQRVVELEGPSRKRSEKSGPRAGRVEVRAQLLRSEEHTSELQSLMRISYAVFCLKQKNTNTAMI